LKLYPWQQKQWQHLLQRRRSGQLAHAFLFYGLEGLGKLDFARAFAEFMFCVAPVGDHPCGQCRSCRLLQAGNHPDLLLLQPEEKSKVIKIDQVRSLSSDFNQTAQQGGYKIAIIAPAEAMNLAAANALLKTLEEPTEDTMLILVSTKPQSLPATIRSRCQILAFLPPDKAVARQWLLEQSIDRAVYEGNVDILLGLTGDAPLKALDLAGNTNLLLVQQNWMVDLFKLLNSEIDPIVLASQYKETDLILFCTYLLNLIGDLLKIRSALSQYCVILSNENSLKVARSLAERISTDKLFTFFDKVLNLEKHLLLGINLNKQLVLEDLFIAWVRLL